MHKSVEDYLNGSLQQLPSNINFYTQFLDNLKTQEIYPEYKVSLKKDWSPTGWDSEDVWYRGVLDLKLLTRPDPTVEEGGGVRTADPTGAVVYDWKSGKIYPDHDDQKALYSVSVFSEHPTVQRVRAIHVYLDSGQNREITYDRSQMHDMRQHWEARVDALGRAIEIQAFMPNPSFKCRYCAFSRFKGGPCRF